MNRHYCTCCGSKRNEDKMKRVWYSLIRSSFWHCLDCMSTAADISYTAEITKTKCIEITTTTAEGFSQMSAMAQEIQEVVSSYKSDFIFNYRFK